MLNNFEALDHQHAFHCASQLISEGTCCDFPYFVGRYYADPKQPRVADDQKAEEPAAKKPSVQLDPELLLRKAEEQAEEAGNDQVMIAHAHDSYV